MDDSSEGPRAEMIPTDHQKAIIRQVEHYFSDQNLPNDAYMLAFTGGAENKPVSISRISGFMKMRQFKPLSKIKEAVRLSTFLEFADAGHVRRRIPLAIPPNVEPAKIELDPKNAVQPGQSLADPSKPWLTKGMLKPTGFEEYFVDGPITPAEYTEDRALYDMEKLFEERVEYAIQRYCSRRKFHSDNRHIFDSFMTFGGIDSKPRQFTGGLGPEDMENMDAEEISAARAKHFVASHVENSDKWVVDFAGVARAFLSCEEVFNVTCNFSAAAKFVNVVSNFYRYLLHHDVCPEYEGQINEALEVCRIAQTELETSMRASYALPDKVSKAISVVSGGCFAAMTRPSFSMSTVDGNVDTESEFGPGLTVDGAFADLRAAFEQLSTAEEASTLLSAPTIVITSERKAALQITAITSSTQVGDPQSPRFGKLSCRELTDSFNAPRIERPNLLTIWMDQESLGNCFVGMKLDVDLCENSLGLVWIERIRSANPSYFEIIANSFYEKEDDAVLPKDWYKREMDIKEHGYRLETNDGGFVPEPDET